MDDVSLQTESMDDLVLWPLHHVHPMAIMTVWPSRPALKIIHDSCRCVFI